MPGRFQVLDIAASRWHLIDGATGEVLETAWEPWRGVEVRAS